MTLKIKTGLTRGGLPVFAQVGDELAWVDGVNESETYDGRHVVDLTPEQPRILRLDEYIGRGYDKADAQKLFIQLDDNAVFADDRLIGCTITLADGTNTDEDIIVDSWKSYPSAPFTGKPVVQIAAALSFTFYRTVTKYKLHRKYALATAGTGGALTAGEMLILISSINKNRVRERESAIAELPLDNDYGDYEYYKVTNGAGTANLVTISDLFKPADPAATHWRVYATTPGGTVGYWVKDTAIGSWSATKTITITESDAWIEAQDRRRMKHERIPPSRFVVATKNRLVIGGTLVTIGPGTAAVSAAAPRDVIGTDTGFIKAMEGLLFKLSGSSKLVAIRTVQDATHLTLMEAGTMMASGKTYRILNHPRTLYTTEESFLDGKPDTSGTDLYGNALEMPAQEGDSLVGAVRMPGDDLLIFSEKTAARLQGNRDSEFTLETAMQLGATSPVGIVAADTLAAWVNGQHGFYATQGGNIAIHISRKIPKQLSDDIINRARLKFTPGLFYTAKGGRRQLLFAVCPTDETIASIIYIVDIDSWEWTSYRRPAVSALGLVHDSDGLAKPVAGDVFGRLWWLFEGNVMGARSTRRRGVATSATATTLTDTTNTFETDGDGELGVPIAIIGGTGEGQERWIYSNNTTQLTVHSAWTTTLDATSVYHVGANIMKTMRAPWSFGEGPSASKQLHDLAYTVLPATPLYEIGMIVLTKGSTTVKAASSDVVFPDDLEGQPLFMVGDFDHIAWVKSKTSATELELTSAWDGMTGSGRYSIGAKFLKINLYRNLDEDTIWKTLYAPMTEPVFIVRAGVQANFLTVEEINYDEPPVEIYNVEPIVRIKG